MAFVDEEYANGQRSYYRPPVQQPGTYTPPGTPPPVAPQGSQIPGQGIYLQRQAQAEQAYQNAQAQLAQRKSNTFRNYGFLENGQVDPNASHGQIQELWRNQAGVAGQQEGMLASHGLHGGLANAAVTQRKLAEGGQNFQLQNAYTDDMQQIANDQTQAEADRNQAMLNAQQEAEQAAQQGDQHTTANPGDEPQLPNQQQARQHIAHQRAQQAARRARQRRRNRRH